MPASGRTSRPDPAGRQAAERDPAERELSYLAGLLENIDAGVIGTDPDFTVTIWNPGAERLYGRSAAEMLGQPARAMAAFVGDAPLVRQEVELTERGRS